jgi:dTMP kinase
MEGQSAFGEQKGLHIGFTGIDGTGKSIQAALLSGWLSEQGIHCILREGKRDFVPEMSTALARKHGINSGREYLGEDLYMVAFSFDLMREIVLDVKPYIMTGAVVVSARTQFCRLAGGIMRGCHTIQLASEIALLGGKPDILLWLDAPAEVAYQRVIERGTDFNELIFLRRYRDALATLLQSYNHVHIDATGSIQQVQQEIRQVVKCALGIV